MCLFAKRLERGCFLWPSPADGVVTITPAQLGYLGQSSIMRDRLPHSPLCFCQWHSRQARVLLMLRRQPVPVPFSDRCQPRSRKTLLDYPQLCRGRPSTAATRINNFKGTDVASVSKVSHTDKQLHAGQFGKAAYTGWIRIMAEFQA